MEKIVNGIIYKLEQTANGSIAVVSNVVFSQRQYTKHVDIEPEIDGVPVVAIQARAFKDASWIECVTLPESIKHIRECAFDTCTSLKRVVVWGGVHSITISRNAFARCYALKSFEMEPASTISFDGPGVFKECYKLSYIPTIAGKVSPCTFQECGIQSITVLGGMHVYSSAFLKSKVEYVTCDEFVELHGNMENLRGIKFFAASMSPLLEEMGCNGYSVVLDDIPF